VSLSIRVDQEPTHWKLTLLGELDYGECSVFRMNIDRILISNVSTAIVDLSGVTYLDSSALGLLLSLSRECGVIGCPAHRLPPRRLFPQPPRTCRHRVQAAARGRPTNFDGASSVSNPAAATRGWTRVGSPSS